jgi:DNA-binding NarL/FixJ family response regulator
MTGGPLRVLVLGEHAAFREALAFLLDQEPDLESVAQAGPPPAEPTTAGAAPDVTVVDLVGSSSDHGLELAQIASASGHGATVVVAATRPDRERALRAGASRVVDASEGFADVLRAVRASGSGARASAAPARPPRRPEVEPAALGSIGRSRGSLFASGGSSVLRLNA